MPHNYVNCITFVLYLLCLLLLNILRLRNNDVYFCVYSCSLGIDATQPLFDVAENIILETYLEQDYSVTKPMRRRLFCQ